MDFERRCPGYLAGPWKEYQTRTLAGEEMPQASGKLSAPRLSDLLARYQGGTGSRRNISFAQLTNELGDKKLATVRDEPGAFKVRFRPLRRRGLIPLILSSSSVCWATTHLIDVAPRPIAPASDSVTTSGRVAGFTISSSCDWLTKAGWTRVEFRDCPTLPLRRPAAPSIAD